MRFVILLILFVLHSFALAAEAPATLLAEYPLNKNPLPRNAKWEFQIDGGGRLWLGYYAADGTLYARRPDGVEISLRPNTRASAMSGLAMAMDDTGLSLLWRDKEPRKGVYYAAGFNSESDTFTPKLVDASTDALTRLKLAKSKGETFYLWFGEREDAKSRKIYNLFFRYLAEDGETFSETHEVMPGIYPAWIVDDEEIIIFSKIVSEKQQIMALRRFDREKKTLGTVEKISAAPAIGPYFNAFESGDRWFLMWLGYHGEGSQKESLLEGVYSDDRGKTWHGFAFEKLRNFNMSQADIAVDNKGHIVVVLSGVPRPEPYPNAKIDIYTLSSSDNGTTWSDPKQLRSVDVSRTTADYPSVVFDSDSSTVVAVWQDWQDIRSNVYASYSKDYGATWTPPKPLENPALANIVLDYGTKTVFESQGQFGVIAERFESDALLLKNLALYTFTLDELEQFAETVTTNKADNKTEKRLQERIDAYWKAMEDKQFETAYTLLDPFFRARRPLEHYLVNRGYFNYYSHKVNNVYIKGNLAKVQLDFEASVPEFQLTTGEKFSRPKRSYSYSETWVFVEDDWYREYYEEHGEVRFTRY